MAEVPRIYSDQSAPEESLSFYALAEAYGTRQGDTMLSLTSHGGGHRMISEHLGVRGGREDVTLTLTETIIRV